LLRVAGIRPLRVKQHHISGCRRKLQRFSQKMAAAVGDFLVREGCIFFFFCTQVTKAGDPEAITVTIACVHGLTV